MRHSLNGLSNRPSSISGSTPGSTVPVTGPVSAGPPPRRSSPADRPLGLLGVAGLVVVSVVLLSSGGCALFRSPPGPPPLVWDSVSPPLLVGEVELEGPEPLVVGIPPAPGRYDRDLDVVHYDIELVIPPENDRVSSRTTLRYLREVAGPHLVTLDFTGLRVEAVTWRGEALEFRHEEGLLEFAAPGSPGVFDTLQVEIMSRGVPADGLILRENVHGQPSAFADNWPNRARFWFPSNDHLSDRAAVSFTVHAPPERRVVANGVQVAEPVPADSTRTGGIGGLMTWRWESAVPIPTYLMVVGVADLEVLDLGKAACGQAPASPRPDGCVEVTGWAFAPDTAHARRVFHRAPEMVDLYVDMFGPYPYEKLANVQAATRFGGMENASAIFYSEQAIAQGRDLEGTVAHEIVHQWFGNSVTPAGWEHLWISEGFASYFGPYFWEHVEGRQALVDRMDVNRERVLAAPEVRARPVVDTSPGNLLDLLNANSYQKGSLVLHMLRWVTGDRVFFQGVRRFYQAHSGGNASTDDFQRVMEQVHGESLEWFFRQWLHAPGYPEYRVEWSWNGARNEVQLRVRQEQDSAWPTFRMPVEVEFQLDGGVHRQLLMMDGREWTRTLPLPGEPLAVRLDPDGWLLARIHDDRE